MAKRFSRSDLKALAEIAARMKRTWEPGDAVQARSGATEVERSEGDIVYFKNGEAWHWSKVRAVEVSK